MNKLQALKKQLMIKAVIAAGVVAACSALYFVVDGMTEDYVKQKTDGDAELSTQTSQRDQMKAKIDGAEQSEKNYATILLVHSDPSFETQRDPLIKFLNDEKAARRLDNLKLNISSELIAKDTVLTSADSEVTVHDDMSIEFDAISDVHVYAFLADLVKKSPGFVHLKSVTLDRKSDLTQAALDQLSSGNLLDNVSAKVTFMWAGVRAKEKDDAPPANANAPGASPKPAGATP